MFEEEIELFKVLLPLIIAVVAGIKAYLENKKKKSVEADYEMLQEYSDNQNSSLNALISPNMATPAVVNSLPHRAWKMSDATKNFLCAGAFAPYRASILSQIEEAEAKNQVSYRIFVPNGVQYVIEYGLLKEQVGNT